MEEMNGINDEFKPNTMVMSRIESFIEDTPLSCSRAKEFRIIEQAEGNYRVEYRARFLGINFWWNKDILFKCRPLSEEGSYHYNATFETVSDAEYYIKCVTNKRKSFKPNESVVKLINLH